jgi:hypothetical protein
MMNPDQLAKISKPRRRRGCVVLGRYGGAMYRDPAAEACRLFRPKDSRRDEPAGQRGLAQYVTFRCIERIADDEDGMGDRASEGYIV